MHRVLVRRVCGAAAAKPPPLPASAAIVATTTTMPSFTARINTAAAAAPSWGGVLTARRACATTAAAGTVAPNSDAPRPVKPTSTHVKLETRPDGIAVLLLCRAPVNSLSLDLIKEICAWLLWLGNDDAADAAKAVVLTSGIPGMFSAGLDFPEIVDPKPERLHEFWTALQEVFLLLHTFPLPVVAAIPGHAPAGGCILAVSCDYRVMARAPAARPDRPYRIGLNETQLGIVPAPWFSAAFAHAVGSPRTAERLLVLGILPTADEARAIGLVDEVVAAEADVLPAAIAEAKRQMAIPAQARAMTKDMMRRPVIEALEEPEARAHDADVYVRMISAEPTQRILKKYLDSLKKK